jgi:hypothetical protein
LIPSFLPTSAGIVTMFFWVTVVIMERSSSMEARGTRVRAAPVPPTAPP